MSVSTYFLFLMNKCTKSSEEDDDSHPMIFDIFLFATIDLILQNLIVITSRVLDTPPHILSGTERNPSGIQYQNSECRSYEVTLKAGGRGYGRSGVREVGGTGGRGYGRSGVREVGGYGIGGSVQRRGKDAASTYRLCPRSGTGCP